MKVKNQNLKFCVQTKADNNDNHLYLKHYHCVTGSKLQNQSLKYRVILSLEAPNYCL
jgi:hypothetical protein